MKTLLALLLTGSTLAAQAPLDLSGEWRFALDPKDLGIKEEPRDWRFPDTIRLPGMLTAQGFGERPSIRTEWTGDGWRYKELFEEWQNDDKFKMPFFLQPPRQYTGAAWYQRELVIPKSWEGMRAELHLERVHWQSIVWIDGKKVGERSSLATPHEYDLGVLPVGEHVLTMRIDNRLQPVNVGPLSHSVTDHTQGNWNGAVGKLELRATSRAHISKLAVYPHAETGRIKVKVESAGLGKDAGSISVSAHLLGSKDTGTKISESAVVASGLAECELQIPDVKMWDEFSPNLYQVDVTLKTPRGEHRRSTVCGFRDVSNDKGTLTLNGHRAFLRGTLECSIFPLTGHPPTDVESWRRIVRICKAHGLNHMRFHSHCPPEAAFVAADELGFYFQVEASSWANQGAAIGSGMPLDAWLEEETHRILDAYGNHPSFLMMAYGNEPSGNNHRQWLADWVKRRQGEDSRRLYTTGAGWPIVEGSDFHNSPQPRIQRWGEGLKSVINSQRPRTDFDWSESVRKHADAPVVSHEIGQWCVYPRFEEIDKYTGYFKARNFEIFRETARRNGLLEQSQDLVMASGKLQALAYKHDIEAALRTEGFGGFQLLDLHDFPGQGTALVGVLDAFWDSKGYVTAEEFRRFSGPVVPLARMGKLVYTTGETLEADLELSHFGPEDFDGLVPEWKLIAADGETIAGGQLPPRDVVAYGLHKLGAISVPLGKVGAPSKLKLVVTAQGEDFSNGWDVFVYPETEAVESPAIVSDFEKAMDLLEQGESLLWTPPVSSIANDSERPLVMGFSPIFWNTAWTKWQPPHTLGVLVDPQHPALAEFPTEFHSNWQWWELMHGGRPFILTEHEQLMPVVQVIDDWFTNRKLGLVFEAKVGKGKLLACSADISNALDERPAARQLRSSLLSYLQSDQFQPELAMSKKQLLGLLMPMSKLQKLGAQARASSSEPGYLPPAAIDGNATTLWHTEYSSHKPEPPHDFTITLRQETQLGGVVITQRQDRNANGQVKEIEILDSDGKRLLAAEVPPGVADHQLLFPKVSLTNTIAIRILSSHSGRYGCLAEVDLLIAE